MSFVYSTSVFSESHFFLSSCGCKWSEVADIWDVSAVCGGHHDRPSSQWQEAQVHHQIKEQQLGAQIQRDLPFVSAKPSHSGQIRLMNNSTLNNDAWGIKWDYKIDASLSLFHNYWKRENDDGMRKIAKASIQIKHLMVEKAWQIDVTKWWMDGWMDWFSA